jgi:hypothetical protein
MPSGGARPRCRRYASRRRRRTRFLTTLPPRRRPTAKPTARGPGSRRQRSTNAGPSTRTPRRKSRSNSARDRSRSARGNRAGVAPGTWSARQPASPFGAAPLQHLAAAFRRHALTESMRLGAPPTVRLERPLHYVLLVRVLRTARSSYRWATDGVKRRAALPGGRVGCRLKDPRAMVGRSVRSGVRAPAVPGARTGPMGRAANPVRQATTAGLPKLSTAVDKCVRNLPA